jgi:hypothetical protein
MTDWEDEKKNDSEGAANAIIAIILFGLLLLLVAGFGVPTS